MLTFHFNSSSLCLSLTSWRVGAKTTRKGNRDARKGNKYWEAPISIQTLHPKDKQSILKGKGLAYRGYISLTSKWKNEKLTFLKGMLKLMINCLTKKTRFTNLPVKIPLSQAFDMLWQHNRPSDVFFKPLNWETAPVEFIQSEDDYKTPKVFLILCVISIRCSANGLGAWHLRLKLFVIYLYPVSIIFRC